MRISDWSSDVCSSDLADGADSDARGRRAAGGTAHRDHPARGRGPELRGDRTAHGLPDRHGAFAHLPCPRGDRYGTPAADGGRNRTRACSKMTPRDDTQANDMIQPQTDKLDDHHRQQLSAMLDGELLPDKAKFMLRRLEHDGELAACGERWQVWGEVMRGRKGALLPAALSHRIAHAISPDEGRDGKEGVRRGRTRGE